MSIVPGGRTDGHAFDLDGTYSRTDGVRRPIGTLIGRSQGDTRHGRPFCERHDSRLCHQTGRIDRCRRYFNPPRHHAPTGAGLESLYSDKLRRRHIQGMAVVRITVDASGRVIKTSVARESPAGVGLVSAAESVAREYRFNNALHRPVITTLPVKFALQHPASGAVETSTAPAALKSGNRADMVQPAATRTGSRTTANP
ncbi:MAG: TonB family protein [Acetobacteraceae bacterium]